MKLCEVCDKNEATTYDLVRRFVCKSCAEETKRIAPKINKAVEMVKRNGCVDVGEFFDALNSLGE